MFDKFGTLKPFKLIGAKNSRGYTQIHIKQLDGSTKYVLIHRLVAYMFLNVSWDSKLDIDHINMNKNDNRLENIRACTRSENLQFFRDRVVKLYIRNGRDIALTARAMNITQGKVSASLSTEGVK
jgi:predicted ThiF/HesA family dinucleotide-utilizing enzyme